MKKMIFLVLASLLSLTFSKVNAFAMNTEIDKKNPDSVAKAIVDAIKKEDYKYIIQNLSCQELREQITQESKGRAEMMKRYPKTDPEILWPDPLKKRISEFQYWFKKIQDIRFTRLTDKAIEFTEQLSMIDIPDNRGDIIRKELRFKYSAFPGTSPKRVHDLIGNIYIQKEKNGNWGFLLMTAYEVPHK